MKHRGTEDTEKRVLFGHVSNPILTECPVPDKIEPRVWFPTDDLFTPHERTRGLPIGWSTKPASRMDASSLPALESDRSPKRKRVGSRPSRLRFGLL
jgi:hypothetical protein